MASRVFCIGNGQSRSPIDLLKLKPHGKIYGCNALYREFTPDVLTAVDHGIMHEIYHSGYCDNNETWFRDWTPVPGMMYDQIVYGFLKGDDLELVKKHFDSFNENKRGDRQTFVFHGSNLAGKVSIIKRWADNSDSFDVMKKEVNHSGVHISWINPNDKSHSLKDLIPTTMRDRGWACGASSAYVALTQNKDLKELYLIGHDLYSKDSKVNNMYKGTKHYAVPENSPTPPTNWITQWRTLMEEFPKVKFFKVNPDGDKGTDDVSRRIEQWNKRKNLEYLNFKQLNETFNCT